MIISHNSEGRRSKRRKNDRLALIEMRNVDKTYETPVGSFTALKCINAEFRRGEFVAVIGKSGSGKSTLANMLTGIDQPTTGDVIIDGTYIHQLSESKMARWRGRNLGIVFQFYQLMPMLSLFENVILPMQIAGKYTQAERRERAEALLEMVDLKMEAHKMPAEVSGGQQQSAAIARSLANDPPLIVADEPTGNLDTQAAKTVFDIFNQLSQDGKTIIMVTHDNDLAQRASRVIRIADGEIINETIAQTFPRLTHQQMLSATHQGQDIIYKPGEPILDEGILNDQFFIIKNGQVKITYLDTNSSDQVTTRLTGGEYFGQAAFKLNGWQSQLSINATAVGDVELLALSNQFFLKLMAEAQDTRRDIVEYTHHILKERGKV